MERVKNYFKNYPESKECFETSDGLLFHVRHRATAHAQTLEDKGVKTHRRESVQNEQPKLKLSKKELEAAAEAEKLAKEQAEKEAAAEADKLAKEQAEKEAAAEAEKLAKEQAEKEAAEKAEAEKKGKKKGKK